MNVKYPPPKGVPLTTGICWADAVTSYIPGRIFVSLKSPVKFPLKSRLLAFYLLIIHMVLESPDNGILFNLRPFVVAISWYSSPLSLKDEQFHRSYWLADGSLAFNILILQEEYYL